MKLINPFAPFNPEIFSKTWTSEDAGIKGASKDDLDIYKMIFSQAEKRHEDLLKAYDACTSKTTSMIGWMVALLSVLASYFFLNNDTSGQFSPKLFTVFLACLYVFTVLIYLVKIILPHRYMSSGSKPSVLMHPDFFGKEDSQQYYLYFLLWETSEYECKISVNSGLNNCRQNLLAQCIKAAVFMPPVCLSAYYLLSLFVS